MSGITLTGAEREAVCRSSANHAKTLAAVEQIIAARVIAAFQDGARSQEPSEWVQEQIAEARSSVEADLRDLLADLAKAEPRHFSLGLMCVRVKGILSRLQPATDES